MNTPTCRHLFAIARDADEPGCLYCPACERLLTRAQSTNVFLELLRRGALSRAKPTQEGYHG